MALAAGLSLCLGSTLVLLASAWPIAGYGSQTPAPTPQVPMQTLSIPLECRLGKGGWQPCRMEVVAIGLHWFLVVGGRRLEFRNDGRGNLTMQAPGQRWLPVNSHWEQPQDLCWDGVCARGAIPLD